jgi:hypothetical protein
MERIRGSRIIPYQNELLVELQGIDEHGELSVFTYQFEYGDDEKGTL